MSSARDSAKMHSKLQMYLGESGEENLARAECASQLIVKTKRPVASRFKELCRPEQLAYDQQVFAGVEQELGAVLRDLEPFPTEAAETEPGETAPAARGAAGEPVAFGAAPSGDIKDEVLVNVFIALKEPERGGQAREPEMMAREEREARRGGASEGRERAQVRRGNLIAATVSLAELDDLAEDPAVAYVEPAEPLKTPRASVSEDSPAERRQGPRFGPPDMRDQLYHGEPKVLVGIVDIGGFDFSHLDFLADEKTRFHVIWDQGGDLHDPPARFGYGSEISKQDMDAALAGSQAAGLAPFQLEPQSQMTAGSHGTHVASIAAGNGGVCPNSVLAGVLVSLPREELLDRRRSFYDSTRLAHAVEYLLDLGNELGLPVSINVSLGTNGHAHDGSSAINRWIDHALTTPGRCVAAAAGNSGQQDPESSDDLGWMMGRIHSSGRLAASGLVQDIEWIVAGNTTVDFSENELEIWYPAQDRFAVSVRPPGGHWREAEVVEPGSFFRNRSLPDQSRLSIFNEVYHRANGANKISIYLSPNFESDPPAGVPSGRWTIRLRGLKVRDGKYHAWIERDDPRRIGRIGDRDFWSLPSFFSERSNVDNSSVGSLACGQNIISVGNLDERRERIHISSSQGPTRDGRFKPEVAAPGTNIVAAKGFSGFGGPPEWVGMTGTSMASPFVAGVAALMLSARPELTASQIQGIIQSTANPLPGIDFRWRDDAGYGVVNPDACIQEATFVGVLRNLDEREDS